MSKNRKIAANSANKDVLALWLRSMVRAMPWGQKQKVADKLGLTPGGFSKVLNNPQRSFDEKTLRAYTWMITSKSENYDAKAYPISDAVQVGPLIVETRKVKTKDGEEVFYTWRST